MRRRFPGVAFCWHSTPTPTHRPLYRLSKSVFSKQLQRTLLPQLRTKPTRQRPVGKSDWAGAGSQLVRNWFGAGSQLVRTWFAPGTLQMALPLGFGAIWRRTVVANANQVAASFTAANQVASNPICLEGPAWPWCLLVLKKGAPWLLTGKEPDPIRTGCEPGPFRFAPSPNRAQLGGTGADPVRSCPPAAWRSRS